MFKLRANRWYPLFAAAVLLALAASGPLCSIATAMPAAHATMAGCDEPMPMPEKAPAMETICHASCVVIDFATPMIELRPIIAVPAEAPLAEPLIGLREPPDHEPPRAA